MTPEKPAILVLSPQRAEVEALARAVGRDYALQEVPGVPELLAMANDVSPELMILDLAPSREATQALLDRLCSDPGLADIPVLLMGDRGEEPGASSLLERGALDLLTRPLDLGIARARIANGIALGQYRRLLRRIVSIDPVTGLANRRRFDDYLDLEWRRNLRNHTPISLVLLDLDHFMTFEGRYGKGITGDSLLRVGEALSACILRAGDLVARLEGGKFAVVLPETDTVGAVAVAERMRAEVAALGIPHAASKTEATLTVSVGVASRTPQASEGFDELVAETERRLTQAKARGRNQVMFG